MKFCGQILIAIFSALYLAGCSVSGPAPVTDVTKKYNSLDRGSYRGSYYVVNKGDTLYYIAYITDREVSDLARYNHLKPPYVIHPGQKINLWRQSYIAPKYGNSAPTPTPTISPQLTNYSVVNSKSAIPASNSPKKYDGVKKSIDKGVESSKSNGYGKSVSKKNVNNNVTKSTIGNRKIEHWLWPTKGRLVRKFSSGDQGNKGIDIAGKRGQGIVSATAGTVVYSGNALRGYGNLIIIKHNDKYLSAYAHNDRLLVKEGQSVKAGQKIATMGSSGTNSVRLHFEIRYQGKSVNPINYLP